MSRPDPRPRPGRPRRRSRPGADRSDPARYNLANQHTYLVSPHGLDWQTARSTRARSAATSSRSTTAAEQTFIAPSYGGLADAALDRPERRRIRGTSSCGTAASPSRTRTSAPVEPNNFGGDEDHVEIFSCTPAVRRAGTTSSRPTRAPVTPTARGSIELAYGVRVNFDSSSTSCASSPFPTAARRHVGPEGISWNGAGAPVGQTSIRHAPSPRTACPSTGRSTCA